ncbi:MAG: HAMP domain-containing histidine kinase [Acidimicrobiales bacterium]|nr:HAMP domain-containing histidine kinase [Acidimicrobiales bacterium]
MLTATPTDRDTGRGAARAPEPAPSQRRRFRGIQLGLRARATVAAALLGLAATALLSVISYSLVRSYLLSQRDAFTARQSYANARVVRDVLSSPNPDVGALLGSLRSEAGSFPLIRYEGQWFGSNVGTSEEQLPPSLRRAINEGQTARQRFVVNGQPYSAVAVDLRTADAVYVEVFPLDQLRRNLVAMALSLLAGSTITVLGAAGVGHWASRQVLSPVARVADAAESLAGGGLDTRLPPVRDPDLHRLVRSFNEMADAIQTRIEREARFASDVSHELRTPLAALAAASDVLVRRRDELSAPAQQAIDIMARQIQRFTAMVLDLLEISRIDAGMADVNLEAAPLGWLATKVVAAGDHHDAEVLIGEDDASARALIDRRRFERMLTNLLDNADRYGAAPVRVRLDLAPDELRLHVDDAGPGIPDEEQQVIFDRFTRGSTATNTSGTGLGLALVREHAKLHGGTLEVDRSPEGGARFTLTFPRVAA